MVESVSTQSMKIYTCSCGQKILIVPDVREMGEAINNHVIEHNKLKNKRLTEETLTQEIIESIII